MDSVRTASDVSAGIRSMREDLARHPDAWENRDLDSFPEALEAVLVDHAADVVAPTWQTLAEYLVTTNGYE